MRLNDQLMMSIKGRFETKDSTIPAVVDQGEFSSLPQSSQVVDATG
jgi:hypothetical protein